VDIGVKKRHGIVQHMHIRGRQPEMDAFKSGAYLVGACHGRHETNQTVLAGIASFHGDLSCACGPALAPNLRLLRGVVSDVGVITRARSAIGIRMPEPYRASCVSVLVELKLVRR